ncbi:MAG: UPF0175 family protein [Anaerolineae bacterium]
MARVQSDKTASSYPRGGLTVHFPDSVLVAAKEDPVHFQRRVLVQTLGSLYAQGKLSSGLAAQVLGCDRWEFYRLLTEYGFSVLDYAEDEQAYEANTSRELASRLVRS